jgi:hypothetical protein
MSFVINCKFTLPNNIIDKITISVDFNELFVWWCCSSLHVWVHSLSSEKMISLIQPKHRPCNWTSRKHTFQPPQDLASLFPEKENIPRIAPTFHMQEVIDHFTFQGGMRIAYPWLQINLMWRFLNREFFCFWNNWHHLPALFKSLHSFSNSCSLRLCIPLP